MLPILMMAMPPALAEQPVAESPPASRPSNSEAGAFARLLREGELTSPGILLASEGREDGAKNKQPGIVRGDFQRHSALILVADRMAADFPETFVQLVGAVRCRLTIWGLVSTGEGRDRVLRLLAERRLPADAVRLVQAPTDTVWIRDFGPVFVSRGDGSRAAFDFDYLRKSGAKERDHDRAAARAIAGHLQVSAAHVPLAIEGGNLLSNGRGLLLTTTVTFNANVLRGCKQADVVRQLREHLGFRQMVVLEPLRGEITGHVDLFACWTDAETVVLEEYSESIDPVNAAVLDRNAAILAKVRTDSGKPLRVLRIPAPTNADGVWRTYTNSVFANGSLVVPRYRGTDPATEERAMRTLRQALPGWQIIPVDADALIAQQGALRCITLCVPAAP